MTQTEFKQAFANELLGLLRTVEAKNADYSSASSAFENFLLIEQLSDARISARAGFLTRMSDKITRIGNLLFKPAKVHDESLADSCRDLAAYSLIFLLYLQQPSPIDPNFITVVFASLKSKFQRLINLTT